VSALAGHSVILKSPRWTAEHSSTKGTASHAVFTADPSGFSPEFFSRTGGEIWFGGLNSSSIPLPVDAGKAEPDPKAIKSLLAVARKMLAASDEEDDLEVLRDGLCFRPVTASGRPIIDRVSDEKLGGRLKTRAGSAGGVFVSAGHGPWGMQPLLYDYIDVLNLSGISLSLGTGKVLSEVIDGLEPSCQISGLRL